MSADLRLRLAILAIACAALAQPAAADDRNAERAARHLQLQMQGLQQQVQDAEAAKSRAEADKAEADRKLAAQALELPRAQAAAHKSADALKAAEAARIDLQARVAALEKQLADQKRAGDDALAAKQAELALAVRTRDAQLTQLQARFDNEVGQVDVCTGKNEQLVQLGADLLDRYRRKGLAEVNSQNDPVLGLGEVRMFNLVQDYRDRIDAQRLTTTPPGQKPTP
jgi:hypothetical protein